MSLVIYDCLIKNQLKFQKYTAWILQYIWKLFQNPKMTQSCQFMDVYQYIIPYFALNVSNTRQFCCQKQGPNGLMSN